MTETKKNPKKRVLVICAVVVLLIILLCFWISSNIVPYNSFMQGKVLDCTIKSLVIDNGRDPYNSQTYYVFSLSEDTTFADSSGNTITYAEINPGTEIEVQFSTHKIFNTYEVPSGLIKIGKRFQTNEIPAAQIRQLTNN